MWPIEAKVLETSQALAAYIHDVKLEFMTCRYAPFSGSGAMLAYLLTGEPDDAFTAISQRLVRQLEPIREFPGRPIRVSRHTRTVPAGKDYPVNFDCFHVILEFPNLRRGISVATDSDKTSTAPI